MGQNRWDRINDRGEVIRGPGGGGDAKLSPDGGKSSDGSGWLGCLCCIILIILGAIFGN